VLRTVASRLLSSLAAVLGASIVAFAFLRVLPSNPARLILGQFATQQAINEQIKAMGLDQPLWVQYWRYITAFLRGDWGFAYSVGQPVTTAIGSRLGASMELGLYAFFGALFFAVLAALLATYRRRPIVDGVVRGASSLGLGIPPFWFGLIVLLLFSQTFPILPGPEGRLSPGVPPPPTITHLYTVDALLNGQLGTFWDALRHLILPALTLGLAAFGFLVRLLRANLLDVSREQFLTVARSKGVDRWRVHLRHALPNAFLPTLTAGGLVLAQLLAGSVLVEYIFDWPGVGALVVDSTLRHDYAVVETFVLLSAIAYVVVNIVVDVLYVVIDPRVRHETA
jgi:ABC-type dipeptide/oligopeptide/nickel transport system permease component